MFLQKLTMFLLMLTLILATGCQANVTVEPTLDQPGHGFEHYKAVALSMEGVKNPTVETALTAALKKNGFEVNTQKTDLEIHINVLQSSEPTPAAQIGMVALVGWNFGVGDSHFNAQATVLDKSTNQQLLTFALDSGSNSNYYATRGWVDQFITEWNKHCHGTQPHMDGASVTK